MSFTEQLKNPKALSTFAALIVPPGHGADREHLDEVFNADAVFAYVRTLGDIENWVPDPWLAACTKRFVTALQGRDPHFDEHASRADVGIQDENDSLP